MTDDVGLRGNGSKQRSNFYTTPQTSDCISAIAPDISLTD